jgi:hypothetical protein
VWHYDEGPSPLFSLHPFIPYPRQFLRHFTPSLWGEGESLLVGGCWGSVGGEVSRHRLSRNSTHTHKRLPPTWGYSIVGLGFGGPCGLSSRYCLVRLLNISRLVRYSSQGHFVMDKLKGAMPAVKVVGGWFGR